MNLSGNFPNDCIPWGDYNARRWNSKIAVIGAGSTYTPELIEGFAARAERLGLDGALAARHRRRAGSTSSAASPRRIMDARGFAGRLELTGDREAAIEGAGFVLVQLRVGGLAARLLDETIPPRFGCLGQETTGAGGFAKALRTVPVVLDIAADTARLGADGAWLLDFTNPAGLVTQALDRRTGTAPSASATSRSASSARSPTGSASSRSGSSSSTSA